ncbi:MAG: orc1/cdc6 family replication initiation protein [Nitrososphaerota archaeon]|nr:orc1/cdc6 family replication initiation protein [Nitrososphaerota archaeon]MDG6923970.1 orc1/cdc6 family replication initiation protein [Nitrososphaerota archaeon]
MKYNLNALNPAFPATRIIGREKELEKLNEYLKAAELGLKTDVLVLGPAGTGKTSCVREAIDKTTTFATARKSLLQTLSEVGNSLGISVPTRGVSTTEAIARVLPKLGRIMVVDEIENIEDQTDVNLFVRILSRTPETSLVAITTRLNFMHMIDDPSARSSFLPRFLTLSRYSIDDVKKILEARVAEAGVSDLIHMDSIEFAARLADVGNSDIRLSLKLLSLIAFESIRTELPVSEQRVYLLANEIRSESIAQVLSCLTDLELEILLRCATRSIIAISELNSRISPTRYTTKAIQFAIKHLEDSGFIERSIEGRGRAKGVSWKIAFIATNEVRSALDEYCHLDDDGFVVRNAN